MRFRTLALVPVSFAVGALALATQRAELLFALGEGAKFAALVGMAAGAAAFGRGEYLRRGWGFSAAGYAGLLTRDALALAPPAPAVDLARAALLVAANACVVVGTWTLARAWRKAGLALPGSRRARRAWTAFATAIALLCAGPALGIDAAAALRSGRGLALLAADLADILALPLVAPVALTALAVRGGTLRWPWAWLTASLCGWLLYDAVLTWPELLRLGGSGFRAAGDCARIVAAGCACAAGLAQRAVVLDEGASAATQRPTAV